LANGGRLFEHREAAVSPWHDHVTHDRVDVAGVAAVQLQQYCSA
jgi:hypothetical protein